MLLEAAYDLFLARYLGLLLLVLAAQDLVPLLPLHQELRIIAPVRLEGPASEVEYAPAYFIEKIPVVRYDDQCPFISFEV